MTKQQKTALGVAAAGGGGLFLYMRSKKKKSSTSTVTAATSPVSTQGSLGNADTQPPVVLEAGESVYDPNSEELLNTPPPSTPSNLVANTVPAAAAQSVLASVPQSVAPTMPNYTINVDYPSTTVMAPAKPQAKPAKRKATTKKKKT